MHKGVKRAVEGFYKFNLKYECYRIIHHIEKYYPDEAKQLVELKNDVGPDFPSEKLVRNMVSQLPIHSAELEEKIKDYVYYKENRYPRSHS
ncbi:hypothetical protein ACE3MQ_06355 [Paenibacillus lentus]|uniref:hypothetical protein n=1 Tax=Paenibacillus lentus TaxID=1338368 RepID=UPI00365651AE